MTFLFIHGKVTLEFSIMKVGRKMTIGYFALISIISHILFIYITWTAMQGINFDVLVRNGKVTEARIVIIFVAIIIGSGVSNFVLDIIRWSQELGYLF